MDFGTAAALLSLPVELVIQIANELNPVSLRGLGRSCRSLHNLLGVHSESLRYEYLRLTLTVDKSSPEAPFISAHSSINIANYVNSFTIDAKILSELKHLLISSNSTIFCDCTVSIFPNFRIYESRTKGGFLEYYECNFTKDLKVPMEFSVETYLSVSNAQPPNPPQSRKFCEKILMKLLTLEDFNGLSSDMFAVRKLSTMHVLRKRSPRMEILSFAVGDNLVHFAAGLATVLSHVYCPNLYFGGSPLSSLGVRKYIKRVLSGPSDWHEASFELRSSNFFRQHLLENSFEVALRLPRQQLVPGAYENEIFIFEKDDDFDIVVKAKVQGDLVVVDVFHATRSECKSENIIRRKLLV